MLWVELEGSRGYCFVVFNIFIEWTGVRKYYYPIHRLPKDKGGEIANTKRIILRIELNTHKKIDEFQQGPIILFRLLKIRNDE